MNGSTWILDSPRSLKSTTWEASFNLEQFNFWGWKVKLSLIISTHYWKVLAFLLKSETHLLFKAFYLFTTTSTRSKCDCCMWKTIRLWKLPISFDSWVGFVLFTNSGFPWGEAKVWEAEWKGMNCQRKTNYQQQQQQQKAKTTLSFIVHGFLVKQSLLSFKTLCEKTDT